MDQETVKGEALEEYEPCYGCDKPVPHSAVNNYRSLPPEPGERESEGTCMICNDCIALEEKYDEP